MAVTFALGIFLAGDFASGALCVIAQQSANPSPAMSTAAAARRKPVQPHQAKANSKTAATAPQPETPPPPPLPNWPANNQPAQATVVWNAQGLRIDASNSSLQQIMRDVQMQTGAKVEGMSADQRIFGVFGPGPTRDVLSQLLDGSGYNVLMIGDQGQGTPREIVLSQPPKGPAPPAAPNQNSEADENVDIADQPQPQPQPQLQPPNIQNGFNPNMPPRTPQQIIQELQQRQQQMQQQQQQQQNNPQ